VVDALRCASEVHRAARPSPILRDSTRSPRTSPRIEASE
jgi:hypothetical protein